MDFVSVNLSRADAGLVLRVLERELDQCRCLQSAPWRCDRCETLGVIASDLVRLLAGRPRSPLRPALLAYPSRPNLDADCGARVVAPKPVAAC